MYLAKIRNNEVVRVALEEAATGEGWTPIPEKLIAEAGDIGACVRRLTVSKDGSLALDDEPPHEEPTPAPEAEAPSAPTREEIEAARAAAYRATVDPITCEIQRLRDMGGSAEEIAEAEARRAEAVAAIKEQHPYPEDEVSTVDSSQL